MKQILFFILLLLVLGAVGGTLYFFQNNRISEGAPTFSNYAVTDLQLEAQSEFVPMFPEAFNAYFSTTKPYPADGVKEEIDRLIALKVQRTQSAVEQHLVEYQDVLQIPIADGKKLADYIGYEHKPFTNEIFRALRHDLDIYIAKEKLKNDVARPMHMNLAVDSPVAIPNTPAYPSQFAADAMLAVQIITYYADERFATEVMNAVESAIERTQIVGVSTRFDTEYGKEIAQNYFDSLKADNVFANHEFIQAVKKEWRGEGISSEAGERTEERPDLIIDDQRFDHDEEQFLFSGLLTNQGSKRTPQNFVVNLEFDRYADGTVDRVVPLTIAGVEAYEASPVGYYIDLKWSGVHRFRFVPNPSVDFLEVYHYNNYSPWVEFSL